MRYALAACAFAVALATSGCGTIIEQEKNNRGGYVDYLADKYWFKADSKQMRALRAYAVQAAVARIASVSQKPDVERQVLAMRIGILSRQAEKVFDCAFPVSGTTPCFYFDSVMVDYVSQLYDLAVATLPLEDAQKLLDKVLGGAISPLVAVDLLTALVELGEQALSIGRVVGAIYRDTLELEVQVWLDMGLSTPEIAALRTEYESGRDNIPAWRAAIAALRASGLEPKPTTKHIGAITQLIAYACGKISSGATAACKYDPLKKRAKTS